jgi:hypothetical protein
MKTLANCTPREFAAQTVKIKKAAEKWLKLTDIIKIRKRVPEDLPEVKEGMTPSDVENIMARRKEIIREKALENMSAIFDACFEEHPDETLEVIALCCFLEPEKLDEYETADLLAAALDMVENETVMRFFTLLMRLAN